MRKKYEPKYSVPILVCRIIRFFSIILIVLFIFGILVFGSQSLTKNKFEYIAKYISIDPFITKSSYKSIDFKTSEEAKYYTYDNNKVVIYQKNDISVFNLAGNLVNTIENDNKIIDCSGDYICLVSSDKKTGEVYNAYVKVNEFKANEGETIISLDSDSRGYITYVVKGNVSNCILSLYNSTELVYKWTSQNKYYIDSCINEDLQCIAILNSQYESGIHTNEIVIASYKTGEILKTITVSDRNAMSISYLEDNLFVFTDSGFEIYDRDYNLKKETKLNNISYHIAFDKEFCAVCKDSIGGYLLNIYSENGVVISTCSYDLPVKKVFKTGNEYYVLDEANVLYKQSGYKNEEIKNYGNEVFDIIFADGSIWLCDEDGVR